MGFFVGIGVGLFVGRADGLLEGKADIDGLSECVIVGVLLG